MQKYLVKTPHYQFVLQVNERTTPYHSMSLFVGPNEKQVCLDLQIMFPDNDERLLQAMNPSIATLSKIEALEECSYLEVSESYMDKFSFGKEIIYAVISIILTNIPHIKSIKLNDKSYIPCNRSYRETLDLPTYYIALYGKTWYESNFNAYINQKDKYEKYREDVTLYCSEDLKKSIAFSELALLPTIHTNAYAESKFHENYAEYEKQYINAKTLPDFFKQINKNLSRKERCKFFKAWLEQFIESKITICRDWQFDLYNNSQLIDIVNALHPKPIPSRTKTRKLKRLSKHN